VIILRFIGRERNISHKSTKKKLIVKLHHLPLTYRQGYFPPKRDRFSSEEEEKVKILYIITFPFFLKEG
jgi:hypothetical protein